MRRIAIPERPTSRGELAAWYSWILEQQAESGLTVTDYAARVGVSAWTLYVWRRRLCAVRSSNPSTERPKLIEVTAKRSALPATEGLLVRIGDGRRSVVVPCGFDAGELRRLLEVLESC